LPPDFTGVAQNSLDMLRYFDYYRIMETNTIGSTSVIRSLAALAHPARLTAFRALVVAGPQGLTPGTMADALGVPASSLSFHLKELLHAGLVTPSRNGRYLIYRASHAAMNDLLRYLTENCCQQSARATSARSLTPSPTAAALQP
jgi:ArsR family transcriptional regulator, arsenate/arsenite/antimonite-responsive transcriptional repressor